MSWTELNWTIDRDVTQWDDLLLHRDQRNYAEDNCARSTPRILKKPSTLYVRDFLPRLPLQFYFVKKIIVF